MVFIDGNHSFEYVKTDTISALKLIKDNKSIIAWHDYIQEGEINKNVLCGILSGIPSSDHKYLVHLSQSNIALFSKSFNITQRSSYKWNIPKKVYNVSLSIDSKMERFES